jgi:hypothetical protein
MPLFLTEWPPDQLTGILGSPVPPSGLLLRRMRNLACTFRRYNESCSLQSVHVYEFQLTVLSYHQPQLRRIHWAWSSTIHARWQRGVRLKKCYNLFGVFYH